MEQQKVEEGQIWKDNDERRMGTRFVRVESIDGEYAKCSRVDIDLILGMWTASPATRPTRIALRRFKPTSTGYKLVTV